MISARDFSEEVAAKDMDNETVPRADVSSKPEVSEGAFLIIARLVPFNLPPTPKGAPFLWNYEHIKFYLCKIS